MKCEVLGGGRISGVLPHPSRAGTLVLIQHPPLYGAIDSAAEAIIGMVARNPLWRCPNPYSAPEVLATFRATTDDW